MRLGREGQLKLGGVPAPRLSGLGGSLPVQGEARGSTEYAAPEQRGLGGRLSVHSDLFSLGRVLLELGTGRHLVVSDQPEDVEQATEGLPPVLKGLVRRLLSRDPAGRPESAAEVAGTLREVLGEPGEARLRGAGEVARAVQWVREQVRG